MEAVEVRRGSTPELEIYVDGIDLTGWDVRVTLSHRDATVRRGPEGIGVTWDEGEGATVLTLSLAQEETLSWREGARVECQVHATSGTTRVESDIGLLVASRTLLGEVVP